ncbi:hypothetical protein F1D05_10430 [Kribbella qitaiheensis]|uniref:Uncharacterized protein n=1 Tax=Kribbella qitaiheensis TaxID=1544730 RepID=A0A7G6WW71_9ACTN|nr:hypothetical protein [Kribbella qitaiheensis]QNE18236.1 hypothetical protein F1D05_10430 [Kribbella qitaiheensis]
MQRFELVRYTDVSGVSGTGIVAEGIQFSDGSVALRWLSQYPCTAVWESLEALLAIHGHSGSTVVRWIDQASGEADECAGLGTEECPAS